MTNREPDELLELATSILDGTPIDWQDAESTLDSLKDGKPPARDRALLDSLKLLERISELHRVEASPHWGHFELRGTIGAGSHGEVHRAWDTRLHREVALKLLRSSKESASDGSAERQRWLIEARRLAAVRHPNVVSILQAEEIDGVAGLAMELVRGQTLAERLRASGPLGAHELAAIGIDLCRALAAVHQAGLLHHDVKASNVMREEGGRIVLMDLGVGGATPLYTAPEILRDQPATPGSDLYALGVLLHHLASGGYPVNGATLEERRVAHDRGGRQSLRDARPDLPTGLVQIIERAHAARVEDRFVSAGELERALVAAIATPTTAVADTTRVARTNARTRLWWLLAPAALIAGVLLWSRGREHEPPRIPRDIAAGESAGPEGSFTLRAQFLLGKHRRELRAGDRLVLGDSLALEVEASDSLYVYVVNEDARGRSYLLYPLRDFAPANPLLPGEVHRLPGARGGRNFYWQVTSAGERERIVLLASRRRLVGFEADALSLERAREGRAIEYPEVGDPSWAELRGLGGLVGEGGATTPSAHFDLFAQAPPLEAGVQRADGVLVRRIEFVSEER